MKLHLKSECMCRTHHLVKTFWGWGEQQLADGTLILTSPAGHTYVTTPGSALLFPARSPPPARMPQRTRTRAQNRARYIATATTPPANNPKMTAGPAIPQHPRHQPGTTPHPFR